MKAVPLVCLAALVALAGLGGAAQGAEGPPDIVVIMVDDLDVGSFQTALSPGCTVDGAPCMPNLIRYVLAGGTSFSESFASLPLCCPSRSTYLTGLYPHNHGVLRNSGPAGGFLQFYGQNATSNLPLWLRPRYTTAHIGKYLNGYVYGGLTPPGWDVWHGLVDPSTYCMYDFTISHNGQPQTYGGGQYQTDVLAGLAGSFIRQHAAGEDRQRPFFLSIAPLAPHLESQCNPSGVRPAPRHVLTTARQPLPRPACSFNEPDMSDKPAWMQELSPVDPGHLERLYNQRIAALRAVDDLIGTVVQALRDTRRLRNTAFLFTSDNGYLLGQHRWQTKVLVYEESIRVPLAIRVPGLRGPATMSAMVLNNDLAPTITALAGVSPDPGHVMDGRSLLPLLDGTAPRWRKRILLDFAPPPQSSSAPSGEDWDLKGENPLAFDIPAYQAVRTGATGDRLSSLVYSEVMDGSGDTELYDLKAGLDGFADPLECRSLHRDPSDLRVWQRQQLKQQLDALRTCGQGTCQLFEEE